MNPITEIEKKFAIGYPKSNIIFEKQKYYKYENLLTEISKIENRGINFSKSYLKYFKDKNFISKNTQNEYFDYRKNF